MKKQDVFIVWQDPHRTVYRVFSYDPDEQLRFSNLKPEPHGIEYIYPDRASADYTANTVKGEVVQMTLWLPGGPLERLKTFILNRWYRAKNRASSRAH